jgi:hypothetical protein
MRERALPDWVVCSSRQKESRQQTYRGLSTGAGQEAPIPGVVLWAARWTPGRLVHRCAAALCLDIWSSGAMTTTLDGACCPSA